MPIPVIIDTDPGVDDALALLLAGASPELDVLAITTVAGNVGLDLATENARRIVPVAWAGKPLPPIHRGASGAPEGADFVHGSDGLGGASALRDGSGAPLYPAGAPLAAGDAAGAILNLAESRPGEVTLITLGPLTNLALAVDRNPASARQLREVVVMGGAFREPGNVTAVAEFNVWADPEAARAVCDSGLPLRWVPLDVTHRCMARAADLEALPDTPRARLVRHVTGHHMDFTLRADGQRGCFLHDPLAVGAVLWPELLRGVRRRVDVETAGRLTRGMTLADFRPEGRRPGDEPNAEICLEVDAESFIQRLLPRLA
jgi:inosine-uridine nucleoside N-ribohydrolase